MNDNVFLSIFPFLFVGFWLLVSTVLGFMSGWFTLQARYPNRDDIPIRRLRGQSASLGKGGFLNPWGAVSFNGVLTLDICATGLRVAVWKIFGLFQSPFLVPWSQISVEMRKVLFFRRYRLVFDGLEGYALTVSAKAFKAMEQAGKLTAPESW